MSTFTYSSPFPPSFVFGVAAASLGAQAFPDLISTLVNAAK